MSNYFTFFCKKEHLYSNQITETSMKCSLIIADTISVKIYKQRFWKVLEKSNYKCYHAVCYEENLIMKLFATRYDPICYWIVNFCVWVLTVFNAMLNKTNHIAMVLGLVTRSCRLRNANENIYDGLTNTLVIFAISLFA